MSKPFSDPQTASESPAGASRNPAKLNAVFTERPLVLLADYPADTLGGGAEVIRSLLDEEDRAKIIWTTPDLPPADLSGGWRGHALLGPERKRGDGDPIARAALRPGFARKLADALAELVTRENAGGIWIVAHGACVFIAARFLDGKRAPVHLSVHDDPVNFTLMSRRRFFLAPLVARAFSSAIRQARSVDAASPGMTKIYRARYGIEAPAYHRGVDPTLAAAPVGTVPPFSVGVLGNTYGPGNVIALAEAMILAATGLGFKAQLALVGQPEAGYLKERFGRALDIDDVPYTGEGAAVEQLSRCFMLYLTYPFARLYRTLRQSSFPTKLSTYGLAARPLLLHTPPDSQIMRIAEEETYAAAWTDRDPRTGSQILTGFWQNRSEPQDFRAAAGQMLDTYFNREKARGILFSRLNKLPLTESRPAPCDA